uniref:Cystatin domain-containing protein n=1 Tax=Cuerna arida TaxID=1464854 RepID=A0A1B6F5A4_9HEMI
MKISIIIFLFGLVVVKGDWFPGGKTDTDASDKENLKQINEIFQKIMQDYLIGGTVTLEDLYCKKEIVGDVLYYCHSKVNYEVCKKPRSECKEKPNRSSSCSANFWLPPGKGAKLQYVGNEKPTCYPDIY